MDYYTNCTISKPHLINEMVDNGIEITYDELLENVSQEVLDEVFPMYKDCKGLSLKDDFAVSFYKSKYNGKPCVYIVHSSIEHVFV